MNWDAIAAVGEIAGTIAVLVTLLYLARQIRQSNRQDLLAAFQHTFDSLNGWCTHVSESTDLAPIVLRGRESYESLTDEERFRFDHIHIHLLNIIESHLFQVQKTAMDAEYQAWAIENLEGIVQGYLNHPGTRQFWSNVRHYAPPEVQQLVSANIGDA